MFNTISFMDHGDTGASATATKDADILELPRDVLETILGEDVDLALRFYRTVAITLARRIRALMPK